MKNIINVKYNSFQIFIFTLDYRRDIKIGQRE